jgi:saccharopine dehydrogenase-like NADP-dependent oxidoreductase
MRRILVLGAGEVGSVVVRTLSKEPGISEVILADIDEQKAKKVSNLIGSEKVVPQYLDVRDHASLVNTMKKVDAVVNCTWYTLNVHVTKASIDAGVSGLDLGGLYYYTLKQLELDNLAKEAGITFIVGMGLSPGITNIMAKYAADKMDKVDEIHIRGGAPPSKDEQGFKLKFLYSPLTYIDQFTLDAVVYRDYKYETVPVGSGKEIVFLPEPFNTEVEMYHTLHSELATLPRTIKGVRVVDLKMTYSPELINAMRLFKETGLTSQEPIEVRGTYVAPVDVLYKLLSKFIERKGDRIWMVIVNGEKNKEKISYKVWVVAFYNEEFKVSGAIYATGVAAAIGAKMLIEGKVKVKGVVPPELSVEPSDFFKELVQRKIHLYESITVTRKIM